jgi:hypothetical protein
MHAEQLQPVRCYYQCLASGFSLHLCTLETGQIAVGVSIDTVAAAEMLPKPSPPPSKVQTACPDLAIVIEYFKAAPET